MENRVIVAGAGLVGSLVSVYLSRKGFKVDVFERRGDMRKMQVQAGRSINLALSDRGWKGLEQVGLSEEIRKISIPMYGRTIHHQDGNITYQPYGKNDQAIHSVSRGELNKALMTIAERHGAKIHFEERLAHCDLSKGTFEFENIVSGQKTSYSDAVLFGTDGAFSAARLSLMTQTDRFEYSQHFLEHGYKELTIPAGKNGEFLIEKNSLHIWPRKSFMLIALPNLDGSFTCTLFFPFEGEDSFKSLNTPEKMMAFFRKTFPDAVELMPTLEHDFFHNPTSSLVTVKCYPWSAEGRMVLAGDAAHAIVPFFGQGMNCGFEDCTVLETLLEKHGNDWSTIFDQFQKSRKPDTDAIADLAVGNFIEMRDLVADPTFLLRKKLEAAFNARYPEKWTPLYTMVTFSHTRYSDALKAGQKQDRIMNEIMNRKDLYELIDADKINDIILEKLSG